MRVLAFIEGRPMPQPRTTIKSKFLFGKTYECWLEIDENNKRKAELGLINKLGKPYRATRYAYRLQRLQKINEYRSRVYEVVSKSCNGAIPKQNLFLFYLFKIPTRWSKVKKTEAAWTIHEYKPDVKNCWTAIEDALYDNDSDCSHIAHYKLYVPVGFKEGVLICHNEEIHSYIAGIAIELIKDINKGVAVETEPL